MVEKTFQHVLIGAAGGATLDLVIDYPIQQALGYVPAIQFHEGLDPTKPYVIGIGLGDVLTAAAGVGLTMYGKSKRKTAVKEAGWGVLAGVVAIKINELYMYLSNKWGITSKDVSPYPLSAKATFTPSVSSMPQQQLMIGTKAGSGYSVYKPNVSAPPCAGKNGQAQMLFV